MKSNLENAEMEKIMENILQITDLVKEYGKGDGRVIALNGVSIQIKSGELLAITGVSGSGKSTLLHMIGAMDRPTSGAVCFHGQDISKLSNKKRAVYRCEKTGFVFQSFKLIEELNVRENVIMPVLIAKRKVNEAYYNELINALGLKDRQTHLPNELSGGQKQRVAIARALINQPELILADEPTGNLDYATSQEIIQIFQEIHESGKTVILVTHDKEIAGKCQREIEILDGKISGF